MATREVSEFQIRMLFTKYLNEEFEKCQTVSAGMEFKQAGRNYMENGKPDPIPDPNGEKLYQHNLQSMYVNVYRANKGVAVQNLNDEQVAKRISDGYAQNETNDFMCTVIVSNALLKVNEELGIVNLSPRPNQNQIINNHRAKAFGEGLQAKNIAETDISNSPIAFKIGDIITERQGGEMHHLSTITNVTEAGLTIISQQAGCPYEEPKGNSLQKSNLDLFKVDPIEIFEKLSNGSVTIKRDYEAKMAEFNKAFVELKAATKFSEENITKGIISAYANDGILSDAEKNDIKKGTFTFR